ncbi:acetolactate synthase 3 regulatory subunit [Citrobacter koseri]|uniref:Acetolactate synthase small subunit n=1 Tax=Citrobacter koseri TaxID=545 RepID=A0A2X2VC92_CITKO|nr:acetolactate synthase 3 regulatory subunit [Citrobacter koseri]
MRRILSVLLENESGALSRVIGLFAQRGYNIESLTVAPTDDPTLSRMTIQTVGDEKVLEQIEKQLHKLVDVLRVSELGQGAHVEREIMPGEDSGQRIRKGRGEAQHGDFPWADY